MVVSFCDGCIDSLSLNDNGFSFCGEEARDWAKALSHWFLDAGKFEWNSHMVDMLGDQ
jgi:hypothetical protein